MDLLAAATAAAADGDTFPVPDHVAPFPDSCDLLYAAIPTSLRSNPQKLRPIRSVAAARASSSHRNGQLPEPPDTGGSPSVEEDRLGAGSGHDDGRTQESGSSLDDDDGNDIENSSGSGKHSGMPKRKRKMERRLEDFVENMVKKVMEKQEQMHKQLVDMIEKKEKERVMREEAWKQQEIERIRKDEEARTQERSRNLALISIIQNLLGHEIQIPQPAEVSSKGEEDEPGHEGEEANAQKSLGVSGEGSNNRWPDVEVQALITLRTSMEQKFHLMGSKVSIWEEISEAMNKMGYHRSAKKCKEKWENINKYYKRTIGSGKKRRQNSKSCPYFNELDVLYSNGLLNLGNPLSSSTNDVSKIEKEESEI
ncbi:hypothetical protein HN51_003933 [Arachis hypogaea]|uniref:Myb-like domain-containing protein n=1 Tax=Arachis hypogaea TaxID=3818 RepID=A0A445DJ76_ARAHY|nr:trihelix transcription factor GTL1 [Arachis hypogaea]QHO37478.1 Trihelix transcription factor [Arachis hypogaea]RYR63255.1 hypothetical protein Ahy_A04g021057 [Arachis hypogaea]